SLTPLSGSGTWQFLLKKARWNEIEIQELSGAGLYQPGLFQTQSLRFASSHTRLRSQIEWSNATLKIREIALEQWGYPTLSGFLNLPFDWNDSGPYWSPKGRILGQLHADHLDLATLFSAAGFPNPPPATGWLRFGLSLAGSPEAPEADFELAARELRTPSRPKLPASELDIQGHYRTDRLESSATLRSCLQAPLRLESRLSFDFGDLLLGKISPLQIPAETSLRIQKANLQSLPMLLPGLKKTEGSLSLELTSSGSLANPSWQGSLTLDAPVIHFVSYRFPALTELHLALALENRSLLVRKLNADLGGGKLEVSGSVAFPENTEPELQLRAKAHEVLVVRSRDLLLRLNGDLTASGPWSNAVLSGKASPSKSRLLIQMDLLPTNLLKRSSLRLPKTNSNSPWFTFPKPPFSEWKFNVALQTHPEDPFLLRGNILNGSAHADLTLKGSGAAPTLEGSYKTSDLAIRMPLAQISVSSGALWYYADQPFRPHLDCSGETEVRNHRIQIYLSGPLDAPVPSLRSDPPLGNNELLSLVLTGSLPSDSAENNQAIAGRAAAVLFRELSGKVVDPAEARERLSALRRFSLDLGSLNTRTGQQETKLTYRIRDNLLMIGELGTNGDFGGQIKYLLRFR
ncbi:MAG: hypothetical protein RLZZ244_1825, partial [Verrucomicrobiota bacterium]